MTKKTIVHYSLPITDEERTEIQEVLKPAYAQKERYAIAKELQVELLNNVSGFLNGVSPVFDGSTYPGGIDGLDKHLKYIAEEWYKRYAIRLGPDIRPEDINVSVSTDGLYILKYSDTVKQIITKADFNLETVTWVFPIEDSDLVKEVNEYLEQEPLEE